MWGGAPPRKPNFQASKLLSFQLPLHPQARLRRAHEYDQQEMQEMQEIQERPQAGDGGQRGRGAERQQAFQSANQLISQASKPLNFQASGVRGGGVGGGGGWG